MFVDHSKTVSPEFAQIFAGDCLGDCIRTDFASGEAVGAVSQWCSGNTKGLIPKIMDGFAPGTAAAIANAIHFSDRRSTEFDPEKTRDSVFHAPGGDVTVPFMFCESTRMLYYEDESLHAANLPVRVDGALLISLPKDGSAEELLTPLTEDRFEEIIRNAERNRDGKLLLPRFEIESGVINLTEFFKRLGVPLFENGSRTHLLEDQEALSISQAVQNAMIKVDEKGTTAAAETVMAVAGGTPIQPCVPFEMNCNHPFMFVLYGRTSDAGGHVLSTGIVNQPAESAARKTLPRPILPECSFLSDLCTGTRPVFLCRISFAQRSVSSSECRQPVPVRLLSAVQGPFRSAYPADVPNRARFELPAHHAC